MDSSNKPKATWLFFTAFMVFAMAVIGAITRLTESGLSMVEWRPLIGALPPLNGDEWQRVFDLYRQTPEYIHKNAGMDLAEFKQIFFWEWFHRLWGRLIGLIYAVPFFYFLFTKHIHRQNFWPFFGLLILGGMQGVMGWYMVQSGLIDRPSVSHFRLAAHLGLAFLIFGFLVRLGFSYARLNFNQNIPNSEYSILRYHHFALLLLFTITFVWGAFVAGLDAGMIYNEFPLMGGHLIPSEMWYFSPWWQNLWNNHASVQFMHRILAMVTGLAVLLFWYRTSSKKFPPIIRKLSWGMLVMVLCQIALGILTLLTQVHIALAALHQAGALILLLIIIWHGFEIKKAYSAD